MKTNLMRGVREPLVQFLLVGLALFGAWHLLNPASSSRGPANRIVFTEDEVRQLTLMWAAQGRSPPTAAQLTDLVEMKVREEVLYREALALGLDKGDTIVRRQLARKMEFLAEDLSKLAEPEAGELRAWYDQHKEGFAAPARVSFRHVYFSPDRRGARARSDAEGAFVKVSGKPIDAVVAGDAFMFQAFYGDRSIDVVAKDFGPAFARSLAGAQPGAWIGPIASGYGWHLVYIDTLTPRRIPAFEEVEAEVWTAWIETRREAMRTQMYEAMRARYEIVVPEVRQ